MHGSGKVHVGICGGGLGGLAAAIAAARAGAQVTLLEAARELGEIGAGIQVFPNVSRLLVRWGVDEIIGDNLIAVDEVNTWGIGNKLIARFDPKLGKKQAGFPHWLARRDHLHAGLTECARRNGVRFLMNSRVNELEYTSDRVKVTTTNGTSHEFDLLLGADGIKSFIRQKLAPEIKPQAASTMAAFRGILSYDEVFRTIPEAHFRLRNTMDAYVGPNGYILLYPLTAGKELNVVTLFQMDRVVTTLEEVGVDEFRDLYKDWDEFPRRILELVNYTQKWPLLVMPPMKTWSNEEKNVVLLGDAAHSMQNHMAQGAATAMEDGAFLGSVIGEVVRGTITIPQAITIYEKRRMPKVWVKQQASFMQGVIACATGEDAAKRDRASEPEVAASTQGVFKASDQLPATYRSWQMYLVPSSVSGILYYDPEGDADNAVCEFLQENTPMDPKTLVTAGIWKKYWGVLDNSGGENVVLSNGTHD